MTIISTVCAVVCLWAGASHAPLPNITVEVIPNNSVCTDAYGCEEIGRPSKIWLNWSGPHVQQTFYAEVGHLFNEFEVSKLDDTYFLVLMHQAYTEWWPGGADYGWSRKGGRDEGGAEYFSRMYSLCALLPHFQRNWEPEVYGQLLSNARANYICKWIRSI